MAKGTIRRLLALRGFGFIHCETGGDVFFHRSHVLTPPFESLREGQAVEFVIEETPQGPKALRVQGILAPHPEPLDAHG